MGYQGILDKYASEGRMRHIPMSRTKEDLVNLTLNDYMGLGARCAEFKEEFFTRFADVSMTSAASRLLASDQAVFNMLEGYLSEAYGKPALLFNSGYHANVGIVSGLDIPGTLWLTDKLIHASVIDGLRLAGAECRRWPHNDATKLRKLLERFHDDYERLIVVCESVYSMDGDIAPLCELAALKREFPKMMLYVDEAHALGCFGPEGLGLCMKHSIMDQVDILVGTFGKACASSGAFVITSRLLHDFLVNNARSLIFSTAIPPANAAWSLMMLEKLADMDMERSNLQVVSKAFRDGIHAITGITNPSESAIIPLLTGNAEKAMALSKKLERQGVLALPIRRPTVPEGGERIRFSLNASLCTEDIKHILTIIKKAYNEA